MTDILPFPAAKVVRPAEFRRHRCALVVEPLRGVFETLHRYDHHLLRLQAHLSDADPANALRALDAMAGLRAELEPLEAEIRAALQPHNGDAT